MLTSRVPEAIADSVIDEEGARVQRLVMGRSPSPQKGARSLSDGRRAAGDRKQEARRPKVMRRMSLEIFCGLQNEGAILEDYFGRNALDYERRVSKQEFSSSLQQLDVKEFDEEDVASVYFYIMVQ